MKLPDAYSRLSPVRAICMGALAVGLLDGAFVVVRVWLNSGSVLRPFQAIAAALLGASAYELGVPSALLGLALHFLIAAGVVTVYYAASRLVPWLARHPLICGPLYGIAVYFVMYDVVIPLSRLSAQPRTFAMMIPGLLIHVVGVGIPAALASAAVRPAPETL